MNPLNSTIIANPVAQLYNYIPPEGDFKGQDDEEMLKNMYNVITRLELWGWLKTYEPEEGKGFMWSRSPEISRIMSATASDGHTGSSFAWTMRHMEAIAKKGWANYYKDKLLL
jgi:RPA family protein